jgi:hypothetical protein
MWILIININPLFLFAQKYNLPGGMEASDGWVAINNIKDHMLLNKEYKGYGASFAGAKGTPLLYEKFHTGNFYYNNKTYLENLKLNYNCYTDELLFFNENQTWIANTQDIDYFAITGNDNDTILLFKQVFLLAEKGRVFMQVLYQGESTFFKRYRKQFLEADFYKPYGQGRQVDEYNDYSEYYVKADGRDVSLLKPKKSSVLEIFNDKSDLIGNYIKKEKINLKDEADLIRLVKYYDSL